MRRTIIGLATAAATLGAAPGAFAQPAVGLVGGGANDALVQFDTATPGTVTSSRAVTGLVGNERLEGIDYRWIPLAADAATGATPGLFGLGVDGTTAHIYKIDPATAVATVVNAANVLTVSAGANFGFDFNPAVDRIRIVDDADKNLRANPNNGILAGNDTALTPAAQGVSAAAYDRVNIAPATAGASTTLFAINPTTDQLQTIGGINSTPSPNGGVLNTVGALGINAATGDGLNFDIAFDGTAYATAVVGGQPGLYGVNTTTGAASLIGTTTQTLSGLAIVPGTTQFVTSAFANSERSGATITVTRTGSTLGAATVNYATGGGTADGADYTAASGTLTFAPGESTKSFGITIADDSIREDDETVGIALSAPGTGLALGSPAAATLTIIDNDGPATPPAPPVVVVDQTAPTLTLSTVRSSYSYKAFRAGITVRVSTNESAKVEATLSARVTKATAARALAGKYNLELIGKSIGFGTGQRSIKLKPKAALFGTPKKSVKVRLKVVAEDAAGNERTVTKVITVKKK